ncbi:uncharacterized protein RCC_02866 [Ramularia collo-cygni]|uniref:CUE domain-containing protein n=1 Tax=Ramularia collo-cygni TaxID=112498 RepID=A0A2D3V3G1_9PEZI|nr:uncharacterized protein RCC_02866 [Ramularia collo-cygni]CZT17034.1 uncharacterized protein RCC_02866 [Ramularia collo-cygni]
MAADNTPVSPIRPEESVTTREEMDFDDHEQGSGTVSPQGHETPTKPVKAPSPRPRVSFQEQTEDIPPSKPPRPVSPNQQAEITLIEAFPTIDTKVVKAVLIASGGKVEPAFNALLGMSDPDFRVEDAQPPPQPPRPAQRQPLNQLEADERLARQLAEQYGSSGQSSGHRYNQREPGRRGPNQQRNPDDDDRERSFFDDDLPEIGRNIQEGFMETQKRVNSWITTFKKKIDGEDEDGGDLYNSAQSGARKNTTDNWPPRQDFGASRAEQLYGIRKSAEQQQRRSTETQRYDADPRELGEDEFERLELRDDEAPPPQPPRTSSRKTANPDLFKPQPKPPQSGPVDEVDAAERQIAGKDASQSGKDKKWQPLTNVNPTPTAEDDDDPFALGDDDDEKDGKEDLRKEDTARLKESARNSISAGSGADSTKKTLEESETSASGRNKDAETILTGEKP